MNQYEEGIRVKVHQAKILSRGEWVYLVGLFVMANEYDECAEENERLRTALRGACDYVVGLGKSGAVDGAKCKLSAGLVPPLEAADRWRKAIDEQPNRIEKSLNK